MITLQSRLHNAPHERQTVYLSGSWDADHGEMNLFIASLLVQQHNLIVIGDHTSKPAERKMNYAARVNEHLKNCSGIVLVFPHRSFYKQSTSSAMLIELLIAAKYRLPTLILLEEGVVLNSQIGEAETTLVFGVEPSTASHTVRFVDIQSQLDDHNISTFNSSFFMNNTMAVRIPNPPFIDTGVSLPKILNKQQVQGARVTAAIESFCQSLSMPTSRQHVFQVSPYYKERERSIVADEIFRVTGLRSVNASDAWAGAPFDGEKEVASQIANALLVIADLSDRSPACIFEVGYAMGSNRNTFIVRRKADDRLPFGLKTVKMIEYSSESELRAAISEHCWPYRRRVFNIEIESEQQLGPIRVFVTYSHQDAKYLHADSLLGFLKGLSKDNFEFWDDRAIAAGERWSQKIMDEMKRSDIALALVSQAFLNSRYCQDVEISEFLRTRAEKGLIIFPVICSPCDWQSYEWLASTQFLPQQGKTIERDYKNRGNRQDLYLKILGEFREIGNRIRAKRQGTQI